MKTAWYDCWLLMADMIVTTALAVACLVVDLSEHFMDARALDTVIPGFKDRIYLAYSTIPCYLANRRK